MPKRDFRKDDRAHTHTRRWYDGDGVPEDRESIITIIIIIMIIPKRTNMSVCVCVCAYHKYGLLHGMRFEEGWLEVPLKIGILVDGGHLNTMCTHYIITI